MITSLRLELLRKINAFYASWTRLGLSAATSPAASRLPLRPAFVALRHDSEEPTASGSVTVLGRALSPAFAAMSPQKWPTHGASEDSRARPKHSSL